MTATRSLAAAVLVGGACLVGLAARGGDGTIALEPGRRQLFLDDAVVAKISDLQRAFHRPEKRGPVLKADVPSDGRYVSAVSAPMWIAPEGVYKLVYEARPGKDSSAAVNRYALAVSRDGVRWKKPRLGLVEFQGSTANNLFPTPDNHRLWHVVHDPDDPDATRRYKGFIMERGGHRPAVSGDCLHWKVESGAPLLPSGDASTLTYDRAKRRFLGVLKFDGPFGRSYNLFTSADFVHWSEPRFLFSADERDQKMAVEVIRRRLANPALAKPLFISPDPALGWQPPAAAAKYRHAETWRAEIYNLGVFPYEGLYLGWFQLFYPTGPRLPEGSNADGFNLIQIAMSRDLKSWVRLGDRETFIGTSTLDQGLVGNYDRLQLGVTNRPVERGDELWFYYEGMKRRVPQEDRYTDGSSRDPSTLTDLEKADWLTDTLSAIHLAVLRRDGFVSLQADRRGGSVLTRPLRAAGKLLLVNLKAPAGSARVEVLDGEGRAIPGFTEADASSVTGDAARAIVRWVSGASWSDLAGRAVQLRIHLRSADLHSFWVE